MFKRRDNRKGKNKKKEKYPVEMQLYIMKTFNADPKIQYSDYLKNKSGYRLKPDHTHGEFV